MYKVRIYKTMRGLLKACNRSAEYVAADKFFSAEGGFLCSSYKGGKRVFWYAQPAPELRAAKAREFERCHWRRSDISRFVALSTGLGADFSYLRCFDVGLGEWSGTSLGGEAYDYCRRKFTASARR